MSQASPAIDMTKILLLSVFWLFGCTLTSQKTLQNDQLIADLDVLILGRWETESPHDICVRFSKEDQMEISFQRNYHPKHRVYGTRKQIKRENNHYTFHFTPTEIWQERYIRPCRKKIYDSENLEKTRLLHVPIIIDTPINIFVQYLSSEDKLKICLDKIDKTDLCFHLNRVK